MGESRKERVGQKEKRAIGPRHCQFGRRVTSLGGGDGDVGGVGSGVKK